MFNLCIWCCFELNIIWFFKSLIMCLWMCRLLVILVLIVIWECLWNCFNFFRVKYLILVESLVRVCIVFWFICLIKVFFLFLCLVVRRWCWFFVVNFKFLFSFFSLNRFFKLFIVLFVSKVKWLVSLVVF